MTRQDVIQLLANHDPPLVHHRHPIRHTLHLAKQVAGEIPMPILAVDNVSFGYRGKPLEDGTPGPMGPELFSGVDFGLNMVRVRVRAS